ncbi:MAG: ornithine carbamoyltransferase [Candidatus Marsarchaeota archaeon]|nr:ornithine carbamoyltransferase [Candidatus Marsarchaeota archaeon]
MAARSLTGINDLSKSDIEKILGIAELIDKGKSYRLRGSPLLALLFEKQSTRTRTSFQAAMHRLGGTSIYLDSTTTQISRGETIEDTAKVLGLYTDAIAARMFSHEDIVKLARSASVPVINALTDLEHPCQALSDIYTIKKIKGLIGTKVAYVGDIAANTANSLMLVCAELGLDVHLIGPSTVKPNKEYLGRARKHGSVEVFNDIEKGLGGVDVVYTDVFVSMGEDAERKKRLKEFEGYEVNMKVMSYANTDAVFMHCLPAHRGVEVSADVIDGRQSIVWEQARNKMIVEQAILAWLLTSP